MPLEIKSQFKKAKKNPQKARKLCKNGKIFKKYVQKGI